MDIHARIRYFLQQQPVVKLAYEAGSPDERYVKAGVVPFMRKKGGQQAEQGTLYSYFLMKPVAKRPGLGAPAFQLCKGTRMQKLAAGWQDMGEGEKAAGEKETLVATALREGIEELGLKLETIVQLLDIGPYGFSSAKTGAGRQMWLFAAELSSGDVLPMAEVAATTAERNWLALSEFAVVGRDDHRYILAGIEAKLKGYYKLEEQ